MDFRGFYSSRILMLRGGILIPIGKFPESLSQAIFVGIILSREIGRTGAGGFLAKALKTRAKGLVNSLTLRQRKTTLRLGTKKTSARHPGVRRTAEGRVCRHLLHGRTQLQQAEEHEVVLHLRLPALARQGAKKIARQKSRPRKSYKSLPPRGPSL